MNLLPGWEERLMQVAKEPEIQPTSLVLPRAPGLYAGRTFH